MKIDNIYLASLAKTILLGASIHLSLLFIYSVMNGDLTPLNIFNILDIDLFFPNIAVGSILFIISYICLSIVFWFFIKSSREKK